MALLSDRALPSGAVRLYALLAQSDERIPLEVAAARLRVSRRSVGKWLARLRARGHIRVAVKGHKSSGASVYEFPQEAQTPRDLAS
jgi:hypothetical protein